MNISAWSLWLSRRPVAPLLVVTGAIYVAIAIPLGSRANNWSEVIYFATGASWSGTPSRLTPCERRRQDKATSP